MPRYFFHIDEGTLIVDDSGTDLPDIKAARGEAVSASGSILADFDGEFWGHGGPWVMHVTDDSDRLLFSLHFHAEVPSGEVTFKPQLGHWLVCNRTPRLPRSEANT